MTHATFSRRFRAVIGLGALATLAIAFLHAPWPMPLDAASLAQVTGLLAGYLVAVLVILMSRAPVLDQRIGSDTLARWHATGGRAFLVLVLVHAGAAVRSWADSRQQGLLPSVLDVIALPGLAAATVGTVLFVARPAPRPAILPVAVPHRRHLAQRPPFSLSAPRSGDLLRITVKALGRGSSLVQSVRPGTLVLAEGPSGSMTAQRRTQPSVLLIAGGVGITPMRALFESLEPHGGRITLLYRASGPRDVVFGAELQQIALARQAEIIWLVGPSSEPANQLTGGNLRRLVPDVADRDVYLCASPGLSAAVRTGLRDAGLPAHRLHEEVFGC